MYRKFTWIICILCLICFSLSAQVPSPLIFSRVTKNDGLASNSVFQTVRDKEGYLWLATQNGLQRYDGVRFLTFRHIPGNPTTLPVNGINRLYLDSKQRLWLMFDHEVGIFDRQTLRFNLAKCDSTIMLIKKMIEDAEGRLIMFADSKQFVYDEAQHSFLGKYPLPSLPAGFPVGDMTVSNGLYWLTGKQGSVVYDSKSKTVLPKNGTVLDSLRSIKNARYPFMSRNGKWWLVSWVPFAGPAPILYSYDKTKDLVEKYEKIREYKVGSYYEIWNVFEQANGTTWIYGMGLLAYYDPAQNKFVHINSNPFEENGIDYDYVSHLYEDKEKNVWVSTNKGLYRFNADAQVFRNIPNKRPNDTTNFRHAVSSIVETKNNGIWVTTWGAGVFSYDKQFHPQPNPITNADPANKLLHSSYMIQRRNGEIWVGTQAGEIKIYDPATGQLFTANHPLIAGKTITQLFEDSEGSVWIGSTTGMLVKCEKANWRDTTTSYRKVLDETADIMTLYQDKERNIWVCTATNGLYQLDYHDGKVLRHYTDKSPGLLVNGATDIIEYNDSTYLIASQGLCILSKKTGNFRYLIPGDNIPAEQITNLVVDKKNRLWVALDGGIYRLNIDNNLYLAFDATSGITSDVFQVSSGSLLSDGRIAIGTPYDFAVFNPDEAIDKSPVPPVRITGLTLGSTNLSVDSIQKLDALSLSHENTFITIKLSTLSFRDKFYMYYMLEGLDKTWKRVQNSEITYQYLPHGNYTLRLKSQKSEGMETETVTALKIHVEPPFWATWWFYSILALAIGALWFWIDHIRIKRKTAILKMRNDIADGLHQDINGALSNITILSEIARMKADTEPAKAKEFIEQISTKSQNMSIAIEDILWSLNPDNDGMANFMLRYREYLHALKTQNDVQIDVLIDKKAENLQLKMKSRSDIFSLFKSGVRNVIKTGAKKCRINITYEKPNLVYTLGFDKENVDMKLLNNIRQRNELTDRLRDLNAQLEFKEHPESAMFILTIPVRTDSI